MEKFSKDLSTLIKTILGLCIGIFLVMLMRSCSDGKRAAELQDKIEVLQTSVDSLQYLKTEIKELKAKTENINDNVNKISGSVSKMNPSVNIRVKSEK